MGLGQKDAPKKEKGRQRAKERPHARSRYLTLLHEAVMRRRLCQASLLQKAIGSLRLSESEHLAAPPTCERACASASGCRSRYPSAAIVLRIDRGTVCFRPASAWASAHRRKWRKGRTVAGFCSTMNHVLSRHSTPAAVDKQGGLGISGGEGLSFAGAHCQQSLADLVLFRIDRLDRYLHSQRDLGG
jgi:hypothetical protein